MKNDNYSPLQRNTLDGLSETAGALYLKLCDQYEAHKSPANERRAFFEADRYERRVGDVLDHIMHHSPVHDLDAVTITKLSKFFAERWRHNFTENSDAN